MSVYFIASYDIENTEAHEQYVQGAGPLLAKHGGEILVADGDAKAVEGFGAGTNVVIRFESETAAMGFYNDPSYSILKKLRLNATKNGKVILAKQFVP